MRTGRQGDRAGMRATEMPYPARKRTAGAVGEFDISLRPNVPYTLFIPCGAGGQWSPCPICDGAIICLDLNKRFFTIGGAI